MGGCGCLVNRVLATEAGWLEGKEVVKVTYDAKRVVLGTHVLNLIHYFAGRPRSCSATLLHLQPALHLFRDGFLRWRRVLSRAAAYAQQVPA